MEGGKEGGRKWERKHAFEREREMPVRQRQIAAFKCRPRELL